MNIRELLKIEEGYSSTPYLCSEGYPTIGIGTRIGPKGANIDQYEIEVDLDTAYRWLSRDLIVNGFSIEGRFNLNTTEPRCVIITSMIYQLGINGFSKFKKTIQLMGSGLWEKASVEMIDSRWAKQCSNRAKRHSDVIYSNDWSAYEEL